MFGQEEESSSQSRRCSRATGGPDQNLLLSLVLSAVTSDLSLSEWGCGLRQRQTEDTDSHV